MRQKRVYLLLVLLLLGLMLIGCSKQKTEEELKAEIRAEMEESLIAEVKAELEVEMSKETEKNEQEKNELSSETSGNQKDKDKDLEFIGGHNIKIMTTVLNVRSSASTKSEIVGKAKIDENYAILAEAEDIHGKWYKIKLADGKEGWVAGWFCTSLKNAVSSSEAPQYPVPVSGQIELNIHMGKKEIVKLLGDDYTFTTHDDGGYFMYWSELIYDDINFIFYHDEPYKNQSLAGVTIKSNKYKLKGLDVKLGDSLVSAIEFCESKYSNSYNHHGDTIVPEMFDYKDGDSVLALYFNDRNFEPNYEGVKLLYIDTIELFAILD